MLTITMTDDKASVTDDKTKIVLSYINIDENDTTQTAINKLIIQFMKNLAEGKIRYICDVSEIVEEIANAKIVVK